MRLQVRLEKDFTSVTVHIVPELAEQILLLLINAYIYYLCETATLGTSSSSIITPRTRCSRTC